MGLKKVLSASTTSECNLGKWYNNEGKNRFEQTSSYSKMGLPHTIVHDNANKNLEYLTADAQNNTLNNADVIISNFEKMEDASEELFNVLDSMLVESKQVK